jgi:DNA-binding MarR family transcriptional regulator
MTETAHRRRVTGRHVDDWDESRRSIGGLLAITSRLMVADLHDRFDAAGFADVRPGSGNVFENIGSEGSTVAAMAQRAGITAQAMVQVVDDLQAKGYVERVADPTDRRIKVVRLTERGQAADRTGREFFQVIENGWSHHLGEERYREFRSALTDLVAAIEPKM